MPTISVTSGVTSTVSTHIPSGTSYLVESSGTLNVSNGGVIDGSVTVSGNNAKLAVASGGVISGLLTFDSGTVVVSSGGTTEQANISGFFVTMSVGGVANSTTVNADGELDVLSGGTANSTTLSGFFATLNLSSGGTANLTTLSASAALNAGGATTLGYAANSGGPSWLNAGNRAAALLGHYIAGSLATPAGGSPDIVTAAMPEQLPPLSLHPHLHA